MVVGMLCRSSSYSKVYYGALRWPTRLPTTRTNYNTSAPLAEQLVTNQLDRNSEENIAPELRRWGPDYIKSDVSNQMTTSRRRGAGPRRLNGSPKL
jgi:hypothetical protein